MPFRGTDAEIRLKQQRFANVANENGSASADAVYAGVGAGAQVKEPEEPSKTPTNLYTTSIHTLVSACLKLSRMGKIPEGRKVFRGLGRMKLGAEWSKRNERGSRSGVELGFMSTTFNRSVAIEYSGIKHGNVGTIFELEVGAVDNGARLDPLSQYPGNVGSNSVLMWGSIASFQCVL